MKKSKSSLNNGSTTELVSLGHRSFKFNRGISRKDSIFYARSVVRKVFATAKQIPDAAELGRIVSEIGDQNIRERFVYSYRLVYKIEDEQILIVAVIPGKRLIENISDRFN